MRRQPWLSTGAVVRSLQYTHGYTALCDMIPVAPSAFPSQVFQFLSPTAPSGRRAASCCRRGDSLPPPAQWVPSTWFISSPTGVTQPHLSKRLCRLAVALPICPRPSSRSISSLRVLLQDAHGYQRGNPSLTITQEAGGRSTAYFPGSVDF